MSCRTAKNVQIGIPFDTVTQLQKVKATALIAPL